MRSVNVVEDYSAYNNADYSPKFPVASEIAFNTILIIDRTTVRVQAHLIPFSKP
jgi:hypothetical protein